MRCGKKIAAEFEKFRSYEQKMPPISAELKRLFGRTKLVILPEDYFLVRVPVDSKPLPKEWYRPATTRFAVLIKEPREISLIVARRKWLRMQNLFKKHQVHGPMRVVTFDIRLPLQVYGYIAAISDVLARSKISIVPVSTFYRDHVLVKKDDLPRAVKLLRQFLQSCKE